MNSEKPYADTSVNNADPSATSMCVRRPAAFSSSSRSRPIAAPSAVATPRRASVPPQPSVKTSATIRIDTSLLLLANLLDPGGGQLEQAVELLAAERVA